LKLISTLQRTPSPSFRQCSDPISPPQRSWCCGYPKSLEMQPSHIHLK